MLYSLDTVFHHCANPEHSFHSSPQPWLPWGTHASPSPAVIKSSLKTARSMLFAGPDHSESQHPENPSISRFNEKSDAGKRRLHVFKTNGFINDLSVHHV